MGDYRIGLMTHLQQWAFDDHAPTLYLAADGRLCQTTYHDDQSWQVALGREDEAGFSLQTQYGGRVGLASVVPIWVHDERMIYQAQTYHEAPIITAFCPNYICVEAAILPHLTLKAAHIAMRSQVIGGHYTLTNTGTQPIRLRFDLFGHVVAQGTEQALAVIALAEGGHALSLGQLPTIASVVLMEGATASSLSGVYASPKIGRDITLAPRESQIIRWVEVGFDDLRQSLAECQRWFLADWSSFLALIDTAALAIPQLDSGNDDWDRVFAVGANQIVQSVLRPGGVFPRETFVAGRMPQYGYSKRGDGRYYPRMWAGQAPDSAYLIVPVLATIAPDAAEGILRNYVALQKRDGFIDLVPNASGNHSGLLCTPILARLTWHVYQQSGNAALLHDLFEGLLKFFTLWMQQDQDGDGLPEWQAQAQTRYAAFPTFGIGRDWAQGAAISTVESPDLLAYLLSEADALLNMAEVIAHKTALASLATYREQLIISLEALWDGEHYRYRDRDSHLTLAGQPLLLEGIGDIRHQVDQALLAPQRLIVKIIGGITKTPKASLHLTGVNEAGEHIEELANPDQIHWYEGEGVYTSAAVFSHVDSIWCEGLSRVYRIEAQTLDSSQLDINSLMPLITDSPHRDHLAKQLLDENAYWQPNGITMLDAKNPLFQSEDARGIRGIWFYWQTLLGEGLINAGYGKQVAKMVKAQLDMLVQVYADQGQSASFYASDTASALGEVGHVNGVVPIALMQQLHGIVIRSAGTVWLRRDFHWGRSLTLTQHGVTVTRNTRRIQIRFPSGHQVELDTNLNENTLVQDPDATSIPTIGRITLSDTIRAAIPDPSTPDSPSKRVIIDVEIDN